MRGYAALLAAITLAGASAQAADDAAAGVVRIRCVEPTGFVTLLRGAVVDAGGPDASFDVVLTVAHGLPEDLAALMTQCALVGERGRHYAIRAAWRADTTLRTFADDWAVLLTERRLRGDQLRLPIARLSGDRRQSITLVEAPVRLPLLTAAEEQDCGLERQGLTDVETAAGLFAHSCRSWHGHSGSPILARIEGRIAIVGVHLASRWFFEERRMLKIGRYVDAVITEAVDAAVELGNAR